MYRDVISPGFWLKAHLTEIFLPLTDRGAGDGGPFICSDATSAASALTSMSSM